MANTGSDKTVVVETGNSNSGLSTVLIAIIFMAVLFVAGIFLYRAGVFGNHTKHEIDININKPGAVLLLR